MGDIVLTQPFTALIREHYPSSEITFVCKPAFAVLVEAFGTCDIVLPYQKDIGFHQQLRNIHYDIVFDLQAKLSSVILSLCSHTKHRSQYQKMHFLRRLIVRKLSNKTMPSTAKLYTNAFRKSPLAELADMDIANPKLISPVSKCSPISVQDKNKVLIGVFPGAAHETKMYPIEQLMDLINHSPMHYHFVLYGSPSEKYLSIPIMQSLSHRCSDMIGEYDLKHLIEAVSQCDLIITNDSGPMHIAAALGLPQIAIFGSTHPRLGFAPLNPKAIVLSANTDCQPCTLHGRHRCPKGHFNCMKQISPDTLLEAIKSSLSAQK